MQGALLGSVGGTIKRGRLAMAPCCRSSPSGGVGVIYKRKATQRQETSTLEDDTMNRRHRTAATCLLAALAATPACARMEQAPITVLYVDRVVTVESTLAGPVRSLGYTRRSDPDQRFRAQTGRRVPGHPVHSGQSGRRQRHRGYPRWSAVVQPHGPSLASSIRPTLSIVHIGRGASARSRFCGAA